MVSRFDTLYYCLCSLATYMTSIGKKKIFFVSMPTKKDLGIAKYWKWNYESVEFFSIYKKHI